MKISSFVLGFGVGAVVALLVAPQSGEETREILSDKMEDGRQYARDRVQELRNVATDTIEQGKKVVARKAKAVAAAAEEAQGA